MVCKNCGKELAPNVKFCSYCGVNTDNNENLGNKNDKSEIVLMEGLCNRVFYHLIVQNGRAVLTNKRFIYLKHNLGKTIAMGPLVNLTKGDYDFDIPLENISAIGDGRQGVSKTIVFHTSDGKKYNFYVRHREEWKAKLQNAMTNV